MSLDIDNLPLIIQPEEFSQLLEQTQDTSKLCIVDLSNEGNFVEGHIANAIYLPFGALMLGQPPAPGKLPSKERLDEIFSFLGMQDDTHFIVCDDEGGGWAGRFIWTLDVIGHKKYSYIDGGMIAWKAAGLPIVSGQEMPAITRTDISVNIDRSPIADREEIQAGLGKDLFTVWDARSPQEHQGTKVLAAKGGHIPGAINAEWTSLMDPSRDYRIRLDAKAQLEAIGITGEKPLITHCQSHHRSGFTYLLGKSLGFDIRAYDGSWSEWGNHPDTPVEV